MKTYRFYVPVLLVLIFSSGRMVAQTAVQTDASVDIMPTLSLTEDQSLKFGQVIPGSSDGEVTLSTGNARTATGDIVLYGSTNQNAVYTVAGIPGDTYAISLPATDVTVSLGEVNLVISSFKALVSSVGAEAVTGTLDATTGRDNFTVGAVLELPAGTGSGHYSGTFSVSVAYN